MKVGKKISVGYAVVLCFMVSASLCGIFLVGKMNESSENMKQKYLVLYQKTNTVAQNSGLKVAAIRGYVITGDRAYLNDYYQLDKESDALMDELAEQSVTMQGKQMAKDAKAAADKYQAVVEKRLIPAKEANNAGEILSIMKGELAPAAAEARKVVAAYLDFRNKQMEGVLEDSISAGNNTKLILSVFTIVAILCSGIIAYFVTRSIVTPLQLAVQDLKKLAAGDFSFTVPQNFLKTKDEVGDLARATDAMIKNISDILKKVITSSQTLAAASEELTANTEQSTAASIHVAESIIDVSRNAELQTNAAHDTEDVVKMMSVQMKDAAARAKDVASLANQTMSSANQGTGVVNRAVSEMKSIGNSTSVVSDSISKLNEKSDQIGQILDTISAIAGQTNLLALNAAIEAARAGEHGRGFAVVAEEVRKLAEQSQDATQRIGELVGEIQQDTKVAVDAAGIGLHDVQEGTKVVHDAGGIFSQIVVHITEVTQGVEEITRMIQAMAQGSNTIVNEVQKITTASKTVAEQTETVSAASEEQSASMEEIASASKSLAHLAEELEQSVHKFKV